MEYAVYVKQRYDEEYESGEVFEKASDAVRYAEMIERNKPHLKADLVKLAFSH